MPKTSQDAAGAFVLESHTHTHRFLSVYIYIDMYVRTYVCAHAYGHICGCMSRIPPCDIPISVSIFKYQFVPELFGRRS